MTEYERAAGRRLVWLLLTPGDLSAETLRSDGMPALRGQGPPRTDNVGTHAASHPPSPGGGGGSSA